MWTLIKSLVNWDTFQASRKTVKLCLSALIAETLVLVFINTSILLFLQKQMSPFVSAFGLFWISLTAAAIWFLGGVEVDSLFLARIFRLDIGKEFTRALSIFFLIQSSIVIFFFFVPFWKFWAGFFLLPLLILGVLLSGSLTEKKVNWKNFYRIYWILTVLAISAMFFFSVVKIENIKSFFKSLSLSLFSSLSPNMVTAGMIALIFLAIILCFIIKNRRARVALVWLAILSFIGLTIWVNVGHGPKIASANVQTTPSAQLFSTNFVLASGEKILINRRQLNLAPPRVKTRDEKGIWHCFAPPWPVNDPQCSLLNNTPGRIEIYLELPPGQTLSDYSLAKSLP